MSNKVLHTLPTERQAFKRANTGGEGEGKDPPPPIPYNPEKSVITDCIK